jgi:hypothetical protein
MNENERTTANGAARDRPYRFIPASPQLRHSVFGLSVLWGANDCVE